MNIVDRVRMLHRDASQLLDEADQLRNDVLRIVDPNNAGTDTTGLSANVASVRDHALKTRDLLTAALTKLTAMEALFIDPVQPPLLSEPNESDVLRRERRGTSGTTMAT